MGVVTRNRARRPWILRREVEIRMCKYTYAYPNTFQISAFLLTLTVKTQIANYWYVMRGCIVEEADITAAQQHLWVYF